MFTGIIQQLARVGLAEPAATGARLVIDPMAWSARPEPGESICVNGCCLTVAGVEGGGRSRADRASVAHLRFDVIHQTLNLTTLSSLRAGDAVNLERAATPDSLLGGHIVQGHVDAIGRVVAVRGGAEEPRLRIEMPSERMEFIIEQGSIAVDGVSLTVAATGENWFEVALIPTTLKLTNLGAARIGMGVNIETDYLARVVVNWLRRTGAR